MAVKCTIRGFVQTSLTFVGAIKPGGVSVEVIACRCDCVTSTQGFARYLVAFCPGSYLFRLACDVAVLRPR